MYKILSLLACLVAVTAANAADNPGYIFDISVNLGDQHAVHLVGSVAVSDPEQTVHTLRVDDDLSVEIRAERRRDRGHLSATLMRAQGEHVRELGSIYNDVAPFTTWTLAFSVCGDRMISLSYTAEPGRCAALPPIDKLRQGACPAGSCAGPFEGMPAIITARARIAPLSEPGEPLTISGRVLDVNGRPRAGIIIHAYHTNRLGIYPQPNPPRSQNSNFEGSLRGWAQTDSQGRYTFETIRPGSYPNSNNPQHVHMYVVDPGCATYFIKELQFTDDPLYQKARAADPKHSQEEAKAETPRRAGQGWEVTRNINLGTDIPNYKFCTATP
ncbi:MAG: hypothetical protein WDM77_06055 [Steroidobacteraceae bacterium]